MTPRDQRPTDRLPAPPWREHGAAFELGDHGFGLAVRWPDIDEDIGLAGLLGVPESLLEEAAGFTIHHLAPSEDLLGVSESAMEGAAGFEAYDLEHIRTDPDG